MTKVKIEIKIKKYEIKSFLSRVSEKRWICFVNAQKKNYKKSSDVEDKAFESI